MTKEQLLAIIDEVGREADNYTGIGAYLAIREAIERAFLDNK